MRERIRSLVSGPVSALTWALMLVGCLTLWVGVPVGWLWIGSQIQGTSPLATALAITMTGVIVTIVVLAWVLSWLNRKHAELRQARQLPTSESGALEPMLVATATIAVVGFAIWFFGFSGSSPVPLNLGY